MRSCLSTLVCALLAACAAAAPISLRTGLFYSFTNLRDNGNALRE